MNRVDSEQETERLRAIVEHDPSNFDGWLELIRQIESQNDIDANKVVYEQVLERYPLCFGFWRKLADIYNVQKQFEQVEAVYERGLSYLPVCAELWVPYCTWTAENFDFMRAEALYERAVAACGKVYTATQLWDRFLEFEKRNFQYERMGDLFWRLMQFPTKKLYEYYQRLTNFVAAPGRKMEHYGIKAPEQAEGEDDISYTSRCEILRQNRMSSMLTTYEATVRANNRVKPFESKISRAFFHSEVLEESQLANWHAYLTSEEAEGTPETIILLYERCIVATCFYAEFWERYARYLEQTQGVEAARALFTRANGKFLMHRPDGYLAQARFEESHGDLDAARELYIKVGTDIAPKHLPTLLAHANLEKRAQNFTEAEKLYTAGLSQFSESETNYTQVVQAFTRYYIMIQGQVDDAIALYSTALQRWPKQGELRSCYIDDLAHVKPRERRLQLTREAYESGLSEDDSLWVPYLEFMRDQWPNPQEYYEVEARYQTLQYKHRPAPTSIYDIAPIIVKHRTVAHPDCSA